MTLNSHMFNEQGIGSENDPGRLIYVYSNGDRYHNFKRFVVNRKTVRTLDYLYRELTKLLEPSFGAVRRIRSPTHGRSVNSLDEIEAGKSYVATGVEKFIRLPYEKTKAPTGFSVPGIVKHNEPYGAPRPASVKPVKHSRIIASGKVKKDQGDSFFIHVYVNGDSITPAAKIRLLPSERISLATALNTIGKKVQTLSGAVVRLHTFEGERIRSIEEIQNGNQYVAVGREKQFHPVRYGKNNMPVWHAGTQLLTNPSNTLEKLNGSPNELMPDEPIRLPHYSRRRQNEISQRERFSNRSSVIENNRSPVRSTSYRSPNKKETSGRQPDSTRVYQQEPDRGLNKKDRVEISSETPPGDQSEMTQSNESYKADKIKNSKKEEKFEASRNELKVDVKQAPSKKRDKPLENQKDGEHRKQKENSTIESVKVDIKNYDNGKQDLHPSKDLSPTGVGQGETIEQ